MCFYPWQILLLVSYHPKMKPKLFGPPQNYSFDSLALPYFSTSSSTPLDKPLSPEPWSCSCSETLCFCCYPGLCIVSLPSGTPVLWFVPDQYWFILQDPIGTPLLVKPFPAFQEIVSLTPGRPWHSIYSLSWCLSCFILITCLHSTVPTSLTMDPSRTDSLPYLSSYPSLHPTPTRCH